MCLVSKANYALIIVDGVQFLSSVLTRKVRQPCRLVAFHLLGVGAVWSEAPDSGEDTRADEDEGIKELHGTWHFH